MSPSRVFPSSPPSPWESCPLFRIRYISLTSLKKRFRIPRTRSLKSSSVLILHSRSWEKLSSDNKNDFSSVWSIFDGEREILYLFDVIDWKSLYRFKMADFVYILFFTTLSFSPLSCYFQPDDPSFVFFPGTISVHVEILLEINRPQRQKPWWVD